MKKIICGLIVFIMVLSSFGMIGCSNKKEEKEQPKEEGVKFETIYSSSEKHILSKDEEISIDIAKSLNNKTYIKLVFDTDIDLLGTFNYSTVEDGGKDFTEQFFIEKANVKKIDNEDAVEFKQYLDCYRENGVSYGISNRKLDSIILQNKSNEQGEFTLKTISISDKTIPNFNKELRLTKGNLTVGADLEMGGSLSLLALKCDDSGTTVDEVIDNNGNVAIGLGYANDCKEVLSVDSNGEAQLVNLINIYDVGREIQQSFYSNVGGGRPETSGYNNYIGELGEMKNGYRRAWCLTAGDGGHYWPYNPVQGGDVADNRSQIIDYEVTSNTIYVKTRAMDWAYGNAVQGGYTTRSYMENWYTIKSGMLFVTNRFVNWEGFYDEIGYPIGVQSNELPATYIAQAFNNYVCYTGDQPWTGDECEVRRDLTSWAQNSHHNNIHTENWYAWVNNDNFGVGMYLPTELDVHYVSGRSLTSPSAKEKKNSEAYSSPTYSEYLFNKQGPTSRYSNAYVFNTSYTAPAKGLVMKEYVPFSYTYVLAVDEIDYMRNVFKSMAKHNSIDNSGMLAWN